MVFSTYDFVFIFLPVVVAVYYFIDSHFPPRAAILWLTLSSFVFYGWWNPKYLVILISSIVANYLLGIYLQNKSSRLFLTLGIIVNLLVLGWYKYSIFVLNNVNLAFDSTFLWKRCFCRLVSPSLPFSKLPGWSTAAAVK